MHYAAGPYLVPVNLYNVITAKTRRTAQGISEGIGGTVKSDDRPISSAAGKDQLSHQASGTDKWYESVRGGCSREILSLDLEELLPAYPEPEDLNSSEIVGFLYDLQVQLASYRIFCRFPQGMGLKERYRLLRGKVLETPVVLINGAADIVINCDAFL